MGYNIGLRLADDLLAKNSQIQRCTDMHQVADVLAKVALRSYLGKLRKAFLFLTTTRNIVAMSFHFI